MYILYCLGALNFKKYFAHCHYFTNKLLASFLHQNANSCVSQNPWLHVSAMAFESRS